MVFLRQAKYFAKKGIEEIQVWDNEFFVPGFGTPVKEFREPIIGKQTVMHVYLTFPKKLPVKDIPGEIILPDDHGFLSGPAIYL